MSKQRFLIIVGLLVCLVAGMVLSAHGATELDLWTRLVREDIEPFIEAFEEKYPDIKVNIQSIAADVGLEAKLTGAVQAGNTPDVVTLDVTSMPGFAEMDALYPLEDLVEEDNVKLDTFSVGMLQTAHYDDTLYGLPFGGDASVILYNKDHFKEAGLDHESPPQSWPEFVEAAKQLTRDTNGDGRTDVYGFVYVPAHTWYTTFYWLPYFWSNGGEFFENGEVAFNSDEGVEALSLWVDLYREHKAVPDSAIGPDASAADMFKRERVSMMPGSPNSLRSINQDRPDLNVGAMIHPTPDGEPANHNFCGGDNVVIMKGSENKEAAWELVKFLSSPEGQRIWVHSPGEFIPSREEVLELESEYYEEHPNDRVIFEAFLQSHLPPRTSHYAQIQTFLRDAFMEASLGRLTPKEALDKAAEQANDLIERTGRK